MTADEIYARWHKLPEGHQNAIAGNFFPELIQGLPESILRAISRSIAEHEDTLLVDAGKITSREWFERHPLPRTDAPEAGG